MRVLIVAVASSLVLAGCSAGHKADYERYSIVYEGIPFFARSAPFYDEARFNDFAKRTCGLSGDQLGKLVDAESDPTSIYMLVAFACGDDVAEAALNSSTADISTRENVRYDYSRFSTLERARNETDRAHQARCEQGDSDEPDCP